jgi:type III restriction enzyme
MAVRKGIRHVLEQIRFENTLALRPVFDSEKPIRSTGDMLTWYTARPWEYAKRSHINRCVFDSTWEASEAFALDRDPNVLAWVKNDHLGFEIVYAFDGVVRKFYPDFLVRLASGQMLVLEVKGQDTAQNQTKRKFLEEWIQAVNAHGGFGRWAWAVSRQPADVAGILEEKTRQAGALA